MITQFKCEGHYNKLHVTLYVECARAIKNEWDAGVCVTYDQRIVGEYIVPLRDVDTPDKAEAWLRRPMGERGNFMEHTEWLCSHRMFGNLIAA